MKKMIVGNTKIVNYEGCISYRAIVNREIPFPQLKREIFRMTNMCKSVYEPFFHFTLMLWMLKTLKHLRTETKRKLLTKGRPYSN